MLSTQQPARHSWRSDHHPCHPLWALIWLCRRAIRRFLSVHCHPSNTIPVRSFPNYSLTRQQEQQPGGRSWFHTYPCSSPATAGNATVPWCTLEIPLFRAVVLVLSMSRPASQPALTKFNWWQLNDDNRYNSRSHSGALHHPISGQLISQCNDKVHICRKQGPPSSIHFWNSQHFSP